MAFEQRFEESVALAIWMEACEKSILGRRCSPKVGLCLKCKRNSSKEASKAGAQWVIWGVTGKVIIEATGDRSCGAS